METAPTRFAVSVPVERLVIDTGSIGATELHRLLLKQPDQVVTFTVHIPATSINFTVDVLITEMSYAGDPTIQEEGVFYFEGTLDGQAVQGEYRKFRKGHIVTAGT